MALFQALCRFTHLPGGFRNRDLRPLVASLLGLDPTTSTSARLSYDWRRLRRKGLIHRIAGTTRYTVTTYGLHVALFASKVYLRILRPGWAARTPDPAALPQPLRDALLQVDAEIQRLCDQANLRPTA
jgi:hypothetical protein